MIDPKLTYAVVGASNNKDKYGYKVFKDLLDKGFKTIAINPKEDRILGEQVYSTLPDYQGTINIVIFVVPPIITLEILKKMNAKNSTSKNRLDIKSVRFQPGSQDDNVIQYCKDNNIEYISNACIIIQSNKKTGKID